MTAQMARTVTGSTKAAERLLRALGAKRTGETDLMVLFAVLTFTLILKGSGMGLREDALREVELERLEAQRKKKEAEEVARRSALEAFEEPARATLADWARTMNVTVMNVEIAAAVGYGNYWALQLSWSAEKYEFQGSFDKDNFSVRMQDPKCKEWFSANTKREIGYIFDGTAHESWSREGLSGG